MTRRLALVALMVVAVAAAGCAGSPARHPAGFNPGGPMVAAPSKTAPPRSQPPGSPAPAEPSALLCDEPSATQQAQVSRVGGPQPESERSASRPGGTAFLTVSTAAPGVRTGASVARWLARSICSLPPMPGGLRNCPIAIFDEYQLVFTVQGTELPLVTVWATGCRQVTGLGPVRTVQNDDALLQELARITASSQHGAPIPALQ